MESRRQYRVSTQRYQAPTLSGVRVHGMFHTGFPQELGRSPIDRSLFGPVTRTEVTATSVINPHKGERRLSSVGEVSPVPLEALSIRTAPSIEVLREKGRSVRSSERSRPQPGAEKGCG